MSPLKTLLLARTNKLKQNRSKVLWRRKREICWDVESELMRAAARWQCDQLHAFGLSLQDLPGTIDLVKKYRDDFADLVARCEQENWSEKKLSDEIYAALIA